MELGGELESLCLDLFEIERQISAPAQSFLFRWDEMCSVNLREEVGGSPAGNWLNWLHSNPGWKGRLIMYPGSPRPSNKIWSLDVFR